MKRWKFIDTCYFELMKKKSFNKLKIGIVLSSVPGYSETFFRNKIKGLQENGFRVVLFVDYAKKSDVDFPCRIIKSDDFNGNFFKILFHIIKMLFRALFLQPQRNLKLYQLDKKDGVVFKNRIRNLIINQFMLGESLDWLHFGFGMLAHGRENIAEAIGAKMAVSFRGYDLYLSPLKHPGCYDLLFKKDVRYHVLSEGMKHTLRINHISEDQIFIITPAIDTEFFSSHNSISPHKSGTIKIVSIARLHWKKGLEYTLEALSLLKEKGMSFTYTIIGEGDQYERLVFAADHYGISDNISFVGKLVPKEVKQYLQDADIYLQYSIQEGFCNAVLEAQSMGLLCIVSNAEGLDENVLDGETGWVVPKRQPKKLASTIIDVIQLSKKEQEIIKSQAISRVKKTFDLERQRKLFQEFYQL